MSTAPWKDASTPPDAPGIYECQHAEGSRTIDRLRWNGATRYRRGWRTLDNAYQTAFGSTPGDRWRVYRPMGA